MNREQMEKRLQEAFPEASVLAMDLTGTENHWEVRITDKGLKSLGRVKSHQQVMGVFAEELKSGEVHALSIKLI